MLVGHQDAFNAIQTLMTPPFTRRVFCVVAPEGVGRQHLLREVFRTKSSCDDDLRVISDPYVSVDTIRAQEVWLSYKPVQSSFKLLVVVVQGISDEAQNSLLKLFEDTPEYLIIAIVVDSVSTLLPTLASRLMLLHLRHLSRKDSEAIWLSQGVEPSVYSQLWTLAPGQPGLALKRYSRKYLPTLQSLSKLLRESPSPDDFLRWSLQLTEWDTSDLVDFWLWMAPKIVLSYQDFSCREVRFALRVSEILLEHPKFDPVLGIPALWCEVVN